jgi:hypothetical protein
MERWPPLRYADWADTAQTLHMWLQIAGKIRMTNTPPVNHSWHVTLYVSSRGLTTSPMMSDHGLFEIEFDFIDHRLIIRTSEGEQRSFPLQPMTVADFYERVMSALRELNLRVKINPRPNEVESPIPFPEDTTHRSYDAEAACRFWRALVDSTRVMSAFRSKYVGKVSPIHFFWGALDLAVTRFSGRTAPLHPGAPGLPLSVAQEAYSHAVCSAGFWPGGNGADAAFYAYAYPEPPRFADARVKPAAAFYSKELREFLLPYEAVRTAPDPDAALMEFLQSTYEAAAELAEWDRTALERDA